ncbi:MAG: hypothetical protein R2798_11225 [Chitinophagales bacterium]|nr:hypothetical protein [Bacteroidota bacterium]MCB9043222.1 hypothetical protein [Chitinophagales bacterium]
MKIFILDVFAGTHWFKDGVLVGVVNNTCLWVTESGIYNALLTNDCGCSVLSDDLDITIENCGKCDQIETWTEQTFDNPDENCCWDLFIANNVIMFHRISI